MDICLNDILFQWCFYHCPALLEDEDLFDELLMFIHRLIKETVQKERKSVYERLAKVSNQ